MEKKFDTIKMVREIRNKIYNDIKDMSPEDRVKYLNGQGESAEANLRKRILQSHSR